jgi:hypothetical protein
MPLGKDDGSMLFRKLLRTLQVPDFQARRLTQLDALFDDENRLAPGIAHVNVNRRMIV